MLSKIIKEYANRQEERIARIINAEQKIKKYKEWYNIMTMYTDKTITEDECIYSLAKLFITQ